MVGLAHTATGVDPGGDVLALIPAVDWRCCAVCSAVLVAAAPLLDVDVQMVLVAVDDYLIVANAGTRGRRKKRSLVRDSLATTTAAVGAVSMLVDVHLGRIPGGVNVDLGITFSGVDTRWGRRRLTDSNDTCGNKSYRVRKLCQSENVRK